MTRSIILLFITGLFFQASFAFLHDKGSTTFSSIKIPLSAKAQAMGGAGVASLDDGAYATLNPALITRVENDNIYLEHINFYQKMNIEFLNATLQYKAFPLGVSLEYFNLGDGPITQDDGSDYNEDNTFHAYDAAIMLTSGFKLRNAKIGFSLRALREAVWDNNINGAALDLGFIMPTPVKNLTAGASLLNLGATDKFVSEDYPLTALLRAGATYKMEVNDNLTCQAALDLNAGNDKTFTVPLGVEVLWKSLSVRTGYHFFHDTRTFSAGFGFTFGNITLDYCYIHFSDDFNSNGQPHFFALSLLI